MKSPKVIFVIGLLAAGCTGPPQGTTESSEALEIPLHTVPLSPQATTVDITATTQTEITSTASRHPSLFHPLGNQDCEPSSPTLPWPGATTPDNGLVEVKATSTELEVWGLLWQTPPLPVDEGIKMVWTATGTGEFQIRAVQDDTEADLVMGPALHEGSNFDRPGDEWGTAFVFPSPGCWEIRITRGPDDAHVWIEVTA